MPTHGIAEWRRAKQELLKRLDQTIVTDPPTAIEHDTLTIIRGRLAQGWTPQMVARSTGADLKTVLAVKTTMS